MDDIIIREATMDDQVGLKRIFGEENRYHVDLQPKVFNTLSNEDILPPGFLEEILNAANRKIFVAQRGQEIVGLVLLNVGTSPTDPLFKERKWIEIEELAVLSSGRGRGIGSRLMRYIEEWGRQWQADSIRLEVWNNNEAAIRFYEHTGFECKKQIMWKEL